MKCIVLLTPYTALKNIKNIQFLMDLFILAYENKNKHQNNILMEIHTLE